MYGEYKYSPYICNEFKNKHIMSKANLTTTQKAIIKSLSDEFSKLNTPIQISSGLIDVDDIMENVRIEKDFENECDLANKTFSKLKIAQMLKDMESIKSDLAILNLAVKRSYEGSHSFDIYPTHKPFDQLEHYYMFKVEYKNTHYHEKKCNKITRHIDCQYGVRMDVSQISHSNPIPFNEFIKSSYFKDRLKFLYEQTIK